MKAGKEQGETILTLEDVTFGYGDRAVLDAVSLVFRPGEFVAVVGPNGCGKSTLLKAMAGLIAPGRGSVMLAGQRVLAFPRKKLAQRMAMLAQSNEAPAGMVVADLVGMSRFVHEGWLSRGTPDDQAHIDAAMRTMAVADLADRRVGELSGGQLQRCRMAMALAQDADILLLDEPTNHLDLKHQYALLEMAREQAARGRAVIAVLHDLTHASLYADRVILMDGGRVVADGSAADVLTCTNIADVYGITTVARTFGRAIVHLPESAGE
ncbi:ABC transporter ATP-binding protein [Endobacterium cereale]|nr:ABC transporter ATP-binding protein [Endobacterium cereale]MEB2844626.1 ABC transporter ATP-binding protein [Endobacterium cereale]